MGRWRPALVLALLLAATPAAAELLLPPGFRAQVYATGDGFETGVGRGTPGIPAIATLGFAQTGILYLARTGRRYWAGGEADDLSAVYRIPPGGARFGPETEPRYLYGPPLPSPQVAAIRGGGELFITTFDRDRKIGAVYRMLGAHAELFAGGTPPHGAPPLLRQPEAVAVDAAGNLYVADRERGAIVRLDPTGRVLDPRWVSVTRPRVLAMDASGQLWIGADGNAEAPWQQGPGEIWKVDRNRAAALISSGPIPAGIALSPGGYLFVADRHAAQVFVVTPSGQRIAFAGFTDGDAPRGLAFAPVTPETREAGLAGDLFVVVISHGAWPVNQVIRISGPFDELIRERAASVP